MYLFIVYLVSSSFSSSFLVKLQIVRETKLWAIFFSVQKLYLDIYIHFPNMALQSIFNFVTSYLFHSFIFTNFLVFICFSMSMNICWYLFTWRWALDWLEQVRKVDDYIGSFLRELAKMGHCSWYGGDVFWCLNQWIFELNSKRIEAWL